jgi:hypothetical protein
MSLSSNPVQEHGPPNTEASSNVFSEHGPHNTEVSSAVSVGIVSRPEQLDQSLELPSFPLRSTADYAVHFRAPEILHETQSVAVSSTSSTQMSSLNLEQFAPRPDRDPQPPTGEALKPQKFGSGSSGAAGKKKIDPDLIGPNEPTEQWVQDLLKEGGDPDIHPEDLEDSGDVSEGSMLEMTFNPNPRVPRPRSVLEPSVVPVPAEGGESSATAARRAEQESRS